MKILFLYTELAGYVMSCFKALAATPRTAHRHTDIELHIVRWPVNQEAPFQFQFPDNVTIYERNDYDDNNLIDLAREINPDKIVCSGWVDKGYVKVCRAFKGKVPTIMSMDNQWHGTLKQHVMRLISPFYLHRAFSHAWVPGQPQKEYAIRLGFKISNIHTGFYSADTSMFSEIADIKKSADIPHRFIYVGRYIKSKGLDLLFSAFIELQSEQPNDWELWCIGTGELYEQRPQHPSIVHHGFVQPMDLPSYVKQAGVFVLPSLFEPWGVVVHEMAAAGMPMIVSNAVGAASRFVEDGNNGFLFSSGNKESLKEALRRMMHQNDESLRQMSLHSAQIGLSHSPSLWTETLLRI